MVLKRKEFKSPCPRKVAKNVNISQLVLGRMNTAKLPLLDKVVSGIRPFSRSRSATARKQASINQPFKAPTRPEVASISSLTQRHGDSDTAIEWSMGTSSIVTIAATQNAAPLTPQIESTPSSTSAIILSGNAKHIPTKTEVEKDGSGYMIEAFEADHQEIVGFKISSFGVVDSTVIPHPMAMDIAHSIFMMEEPRTSMRSPILNLCQRSVNYILARIACQRSASRGATVLNFISSVSSDTIPLTVAEQSTTE